MLPFTTAAQEKITLSVGSWPPYISQDQKHNGVVAHIITDIFSDIGISVSFRFLPWARAYDDAAKGLSSATAVWMHKEKRSVDFIYSDAILIEQFVFFHNKGSSFNWKSVDDLKNLEIGGIIAFSYGSELNHALSQGEVVIDRVKQPQQNFKKLLYN